ncbi:MAG: DUF1553 domain-containing protein [Planctomycetaceae bacterium]
MSAPWSRLVAILVALGPEASLVTAAGTTSAPSFSREIRGLLSNRCIRCHGPDAAARQGGGSEGLRLDSFEGATADLGDGRAAIHPGSPDESEMIHRITSSDPDVVMPPPDAGEPLSTEEVDRFRRWIASGAVYEPHWAYVPPRRAGPPAVRNTSWARNPIDRFILARLEAEALEPQPEAPRAVLARRLALDLTGLPPSPDMVDAFAADESEDAVGRFVDRLLEHEGRGEHLARQWLDLARYADSAGYADDRPRTIWGWRDWVIAAFDENMPFDQFTIRQIAGDLLPDAASEDRIATAFHRNTLTNSEGGTIDEEFRTVAIVDRVNTTMSTWMGTTIACSQCHDHKYDPLSQKDFFSLYAIFNNTADADRPGEEPLLEFFTPAQRALRSRLESELAAVEKLLGTDTPALTAARDAWDRSFPRDVPWQPVVPAAAGVENAPAESARIADDGRVFLAAPGSRAVSTIAASIAGGPLAGIRLEFPGDDSLPAKGSGRAADGSFVLSGVSARLEPSVGSTPSGRFVRVQLPGKGLLLSLAEVEVFAAGGDANIARGRSATQASTDFDGDAARAVDGETNGDYFVKNSVTHTATGDDPWWEVDLGESKAIGRIVVWNRTDGGTGARLAGARVSILDAARQPVWTGDLATAPAPSTTFSPSGGRDVPLAAALADRTAAGFDAAMVLRKPADPKDEKAVKAEAEGGWSPGAGSPSTLTLLPAAVIDVPEGMRLVVTLRQLSNRDGHTVGVVRLGASRDPRGLALAALPADVITILATPAEARNQTQLERLADYHRRAVAAETAASRTEKQRIETALAAIKPATVPVMQELEGAQRRVTKLQHRGNWQDLGPEVGEGIPAAFPQPKLAVDGRLDRLALARWLVDRDNPLTARVVVNRIWERLFGVGLVATSEEFGSQGELPSHPELLDWLACELVDGGWNLRALERLIVTSAAYRQRSKAPAELVARDPNNRLVARGPRVRLSAEVIRDQSLAAAGLLSGKKGGPSVNPPQPNVGLSAAFGSGIDWKTSDGEDRHRRAIYTTWRRSNPYPSMATFDAPNREVCTVRRPRTNTPLQALVTLNDPVYVEASQALARRMVREGGSSVADRATRGFRLVLAREPSVAERDRLVRLHGDSLADFSVDAARAKKMATDPLGPVPSDLAVEEADLAAWTVVANVILNLDEAFMCP